MAEVHRLHPDGTYHLLTSDLPEAYSTEPLDQLIVRSFLPEEKLCSATVPLPLVYDEHIPVDEVHLAKLKAEMATEAEKTGGTGQLIPVLLAHIPGFDRLPILDGFHRYEILRRIGAPVVSARVRLDCDWLYVAEQRIRLAGSHAPVRLSRFLEWIGEAWKHTEWAGKLSVKQAFAMGAKGERRTGETFDLSRAEAALVREWAADRSQECNLSASSIHRHLVMAEAADPTLIRQVREGGVGTLFSTKHLEVVARAFPGVANYSHQNALAQVIAKNRLTIVQTRAVIQALAQARTEKQIDQALGSGLPGVLAQTGHPVKHRKQSAPVMPLPSIAERDDAQYGALIEVTKKYFQREMEMVVMQAERTAFLDATVNRDLGLGLFQNLVKDAAAEILPLVLRTLNFHEARLHVARSTPETLAHAAGTKPRSVPAPYLRALQTELPYLNDLQRNAVTLKTFLGLQPSIIARILGTTEQDARNAFNQAHHRVLQAHRPDFS